MLGGRSYYPQTAVVDSLDDALQVAKSIGFPVVMKVSSARVLHKTEAGGVITNIGANQRLRQPIKNARRLLIH
jgi:acyl-CoA synthetase (NDP forming)